MDSASSHPKRLGKYDIAETLVPTGKIQLYRAVEDAAQRSVTLKAIVRNVFDPETTATIAEFKEQARISACLEHPGIVPVYEYGEDNDCAFLASEYVEGCTLKEGLGLPLPDALSIVVQVLDALEYAQGQGVLHGNIAPCKLLLTSKGRIRINDFGIARLDGGAESYASPERLQGLQIDHRSDIFSVGILLYELLTGFHPFAGPPETLRERICDERERPASEANSRVSANFDAICAKSLAKAVEARYPAAGAFRDVIRRAYEADFGSPPREFVLNDVVVSIFLSSLRGSLRRRSRSKRQQPNPEFKQPTPIAPRKWEDPILRAIEKQLAVFIGPLAGVVVQEAASKTVDTEELYSMVAENLDAEEDRRAFFARKGEVRSNKVAQDQLRRVQAPVSPDSATATMLGAGSAPISSPAPRPAPNIDLKLPAVRDAESSPQVTAEAEHKPQSKRAVDMPVVQKIESACRPVTSVEALPQGELRPEIKSHLNSSARTAGKSKVKSQRQPQIPSVSQSSNLATTEYDVPARLEELLGKQPENLSGYLRDGTPLLNEIIYAFVAVVEALAASYASNSKVGGLVPQSICFDRLGKATIQNNQPEATQSTSGSGMVGSPRYAAPEIFTENSGSDTTGVAANVYALGFMFFEIALGRQLFRKTFSAQHSDFDWMRWHADLKTKAPALRSLLPECSASFSDLVGSMIEKDPGKRTTELDTILSRLRAIAQQASQTMILSKPAESAQTASKASSETVTKTGKPLVVAALFAIIIALALGGFFAWQNPDILRKLMAPFFHATQTNDPSQKSN